MVPIIITMKKPNKNMEKTSFYLDREVLDKAIKKLGNNATVSGTLRQALEDIVSTEVVRLAVSKEAKSKYDKIVQYPSGQKVMEELFEEVLEKAKESITKQVGNLW